MIVYYGTEIFQRLKYKITSTCFIEKGGCNQGICIVPFENNMTAVLKNVGIQCVKKSEIDTALKIKKEVLKPYISTQKYSFDLSPDINRFALRLCFRVILEPPNSKPICLPPVYSNVIKDSKVSGDLKIFNCR